MTYFFDNNIARHVALRLCALGFDAIHLRDSGFPSNIHDEVLIPIIAQRGWVLVTADYGIRRKKPERDALVYSGLTAIFYPRRLVNRSGPDQVAWFEEHWCSIAAQVEGPRTWKTAYLTNDGKVCPF